MKPTQQEIIDLAREAGHPDAILEFAPAAIERLVHLALERFGAGGGEPVAWPAGSAQLHISLLNMGKAMAKERSREIGDAWNQLADLLALLAKSRDIHPSPADLRDEYLRGLEEGFKEGWIECSKWAQRDDLIADIGSPSYEACVSAVKALKGKQ